jgi:hypothetical protein
MCPPIEHSYCGLTLYIIQSVDAHSPNTGVTPNFRLIALAANYKFALAVFYKLRHYH